jgi:dipeptidyl aminopeptidase/acylaminoacyl peptidase
MPWTSAELWVADVDAKGELIRLHQVAGGLGESIFQPEWSPDAVLYFVSDRTGWWNLYRWRDGTIEHVLPMEAEFGQPQWCFGMSTYAFESQRSLVFAYAVRGSWKLGQLETSNLHWRPIDLPYKEISDVQARPGSAVFCAGSPTEPLAVALLDLKSNAIKLIRSASPTRPELARYISVPKEIEFPTENGKTAHAFYYPPHNPEFSAPAEELPPLLVKIHGGPTAAASSTLDLRVQYWTSRGFAVIDVNYGGSTGYGREYRFRLEHGWGVVDLDDCVNAAKFLIQRGLVEPSKLAISGGSAGGYTTLCALTFRETFHAGASYYGICDLEALARVTHKFESRYLEWLIGPYPQQVELYRQRSPINFVERLAVPTVFFQGEEDPIVRPNQAELMVDALRARGVPFGYLLFSGEQHGFRRATSIKQALDAELYFYSVQLLRRGLRF